jgi:hypothetical protein
VPAAYFVRIVASRTRDATDALSLRYEMLCELIPLIPLFVRALRMSRSAFVGIVGEQFRVIAVLTTLVPLTTLGDARRRP